MEERRRGGILGGPVDARARLRAAYPTVEARTGTRATHRASRFLGAVVGCRGDLVTLRSGSGTERTFRMIPGAFSVGGETVTLVRPAPTPATPSAPTRTASGSVAVRGAPARVARASRLLVEGVHDAELVERVWGDDLRLEGVVVERLDGVDHLAEVVRAFDPGPARRLGVLVDHLVEGSKEARTAAGVRHPHVLVTGTPYVDVWAAVRPRRLGLERWPDVPRPRPWKEGIAEALGEDDLARCWRRILGAVRSYADLEPPLVGAVERLIDFLTEPTGPDGG